ncbi:hypothetical protein [Halobacterium noricense]|uniref:hypothetical protein n=1 Tax=Halobacterium noricense TaxID=223182 RepID=UPI001E47E594|nr:hypothetical protein [Halobacterium noricense]UHH24033.1 hypothetical protein LT974_08505 [Halobacterium noricense]
MSEDPISGDDLVTDSPRDAANETSEESNPQLLLYRTLRDETQSRTAQHQQRLLSGLSVIGVIIAYALLSGEFVFLAVIPIVVGFVAIQTAQYLNNLYFITRHLSRIEHAHTDEYPLFEWEHRYGIAGTDRTVVRWGIDWSSVPQLIILVLAALGYLGSIYVAYVVWPPTGIEVLAIGLTRSGLLGIYALLTGLICLAGYSFYLHHAKLTAVEP